MPHLMFTERVSPFGMEESIARIQHNFQNTGNGWPLSGLRNPARAVQSGGCGADAGASAHCKRFGQHAGGIASNLASAVRRPSSSTLHP